MMYMHYCKNCNRFHMLNGHKFDCPSCSAPLAELAISYLEFANMDISEREEYKEKCRDSRQLAELSTTYRMYKYSKWYKSRSVKIDCSLPAIPEDSFPLNEDFDETGLEPEL